MAAGSGASSGFQLTISICASVAPWIRSLSESARVSPTARDCGASTTAGRARCVRT